MIFSKKAQSTIEYTAVAVLVMTGILLGGPYVIRSINAHFQRYETTAQESFREEIEQSDFILPGTPPCVCSDTYKDTGVCGNGINCPENFQYWRIECNFPGCETTVDPNKPLFECRPDPGPNGGSPKCCTPPIETGLCGWMYPSGSPDRPCPGDDEMLMITRCGADADGNPIEEKEECVPNWKCINQCIGQLDTFAEWCDEDNCCNDVPPDTGITYFNPGRCPTQPGPCQAECQEGYGIPFGQQGGACIPIQCGNNSKDVGFNISETCDGEAPYGPLIVQYREDPSSSCAGKPSVIPGYESFWNYFDNGKCHAAMNVCTNDCNYVGATFPVNNQRGRIHINVLSEDFKIISINDYRKTGDPPDAYYGNAIPCYPTPGSPGDLDQYEDRNPVTNRLYPDCQFSPHRVECTKGRVVELLPTMPQGSSPYGNNIKVTCEEGHQIAVENTREYATYTDILCSMIGIKSFGDNNESVMGFLCVCPPGQANFGDGQCAFDKALKVSVGNHHSCAAHDSGTVRCWGARGTNTYYSQPYYGGDAVDVSVAKGDNLTCVQLSNGKVWCYGDTYNNFGEYVNASGNAIETKAFDYARTHYCWLDKNNAKFPESGRVLCGGSGGSEASGSQGATGDQDGLAVTSGYDHNCMIQEDKTVHCWGDSGGNKLNLSEGRPNPLIPIPSDDIQDYTGASSRGKWSDAITYNIDASYEHTCATWEDQELNIRRAACWGAQGTGNRSQPIFLGSEGKIAINKPPFSRDITWFENPSSTLAQNQKKPVNLNNGQTFIMHPAYNYSSSQSDIYRVTGSGTNKRHWWHIYLTDNNGNETGEHGWIIAAPAYTPNTDGNRFPYLIQTEVDSTLTVANDSYTLYTTPKEVKTITAGAGHSCAVTTDNTVVCWGWNANSRAVTPAIFRNNTPNRPEIIDVDSYSHTCAIIDPPLANGDQIICWGENTHGEGRNYPSVFLNPGNVVLNDFDHGDDAVIIVDNTLLYSGFDPSAGGTSSGPVLSVDTPVTVIIAPPDTANVGDDIGPLVAVINNQNTYWWYIDQDGNLSSTSDRYYVADPNISHPAPVSANPDNSFTAGDFAVVTGDLTIMDSPESIIAEPLPSGAPLTLTTGTQVLVDANVAYQATDMSWWWSVQYEYDAGGTSTEVIYGWISDANLDPAP